MKVMSTLMTAFVLCAPAFADNNNNNNNGAPETQPKGKRPAVSFGFRDIQSGNDQAPAKKPAPAAAPAPTAKPAKKGPTTKTY